MPSGESVSLSLLKNSHAFVAEAVSKVLAAQSDLRQWQFAVLCLVQAAELSLKAALLSIHPILVYDNIDNPTRMVSLHKALRRLEHLRIGAITFSARDERRIRYASQLRNRITHSDFALTQEYATANFFELFGFVSHFQRRHLSTDLSEIIPAAHFDALVKIRRALKELVRRARARIEEESIDEELIWVCPACGEETFVIQDGVDKCYACSHGERVVECSQCSQFCFESEVESFVEDLDTDYEEGRTVMHESYGYAQYDACPECLPNIRQDIQDQREGEEFYRLEEEYRLRED